MIDRLELPLFRNSDPDTSRDAAKRAAVAAPSLEARILDALAFRSMTDKALCQALGVDPEKWGSVKTARSRLKNRGLVCWNGEKRDHQRIWALPQNVPTRYERVRSEYL